MAFFLHTLFLSLAVLLTYLWTTDPVLSSFTLQAVGTLILLYFASRLFVSKATRLSNTFDAVIFASLTFLLVLSTGGLASPLFFTLYFLLFTISLFFEPLQAFLLAGVIAAVLAVSLKFQFTGPTAVSLITLFLISPLAAIFGRKYLEAMESLGKIKRLGETIASEETDTLIWLSTKARPTLTGIIDTVSELIGSSTLPFRLRERLRELHGDLLSLHQSAKDLEKKIDEQTDAL